MQGNTASSEALSFCNTLQCKVQSMLNRNWLKYSGIFLISILFFLHVHLVPNLEILWIDSSSCKISVKLLDSGSMHAQKLTIFIVFLLHKSMHPHFQRGRTRLHWLTDYTEKWERVIQTSSGWNIHVFFCFSIQSFIWVDYVQNVWSHHKFPHCALY